MRKFAWGMIFREKIAQKQGFLDHKIRVFELRFSQLDVESESRSAVQDQYFRCKKRENRIFFIEQI